MSDLQKILRLIYSTNCSEIHEGIALLAKIDAQEKRLLLSRNSASLKWDCLQEFAAIEGLEFHRAGLWLNGLKTLPPESAFILGKKRGALGLAGLENISEEVARSLCGHQGALYLDGLKKLTDPIAIAIGSHQGPIFLRGLKEISASSAAALKNQGADVVFGKSLSIPEEAKGILLKMPGYKGPEIVHSQESFDVLSTLLEVKPFILARLCGLETRYWRWRRKAPLPLYKIFTIPKSGGGVRVIHQPSETLAWIQGLIKERILDAAPVHSECVSAFRAGLSIVDHAAQHCGKSIVVKIDLKDFFPTVTFPKVESVFRRLGFSGGVARQLAFLTTTNLEIVSEGDISHDEQNKKSRALPQGAATSPQLANMAAKRLDTRILGLVEKLGFRYSRYADDLTFSSEDAMAKVNILIRAVSEIILDCGFIVNPSKTRVMRAPATQRITGLILGGDTPRVPRATMRRIRSMQHHQRTRSDFESSNQLSGYLSFVKMVNQEQFKKLNQNIGEK